MFSRPLFLALAFSASASLSLAKPGAPFSDNMVLQRDRPVPVWGKSSPGQTVKVSFAGQEKSAVADAKGSWSLRLDPMPASSEPRDFIVDEGLPKAIKNVLVGEVWLCSGQSNMGFTVAEAADADKEIASANDPEIRFLGNAASKGWKSCTPETVGAFSAVAYSFARELHRQLNVPIGILSLSVGGTSAMQWTPRAALQADPALWADTLQHMGLRYAHELWGKRRAALRNPSAPAAALPSPDQYILPRIGGFYESLITRVIPFAIRGVAWYQGEGDADYPDVYAKTFPLLIRSWREAWGEGDFPFLFVQIPNYDTPTATKWVRQREVQASALSIPNTGMVVTIDIGEARNLHPKNKQTVGRRLGLLAMNKVYGADVVASGPVFDSFAIEGDTIRVRFKKSPSPLKLTGPGGFLIAASDRKFVPAQAHLDGAGLIISSDQVKNPVAVRYAWDDVPEVTVYNEAGLPSAPFRTDDWAPVSEGPVYKSFTVEGGKIRIKFEPSPYPLQLHGKAYREVTVAGADRVFKPAKIALDGSDLLVWSDEVPQPVAVRSSWGSEQNADGIFDSAEQQALPFRTDDWPPETF